MVTGFIQIQRLIFPLLRVWLILKTLYWLGYKIPMKIGGELITVGSDGIHYIKIVRKEMQHLTNEEERIRKECIARSLPPPPDQPPVLVLGKLRQIVKKHAPKSE